ncbi:hypothetical protein ABEB36_008124 [Hypothenemus hampei]|uniref:DUF3752 domain-containing protein n=1 Tax=Hypothenemus hampei TaxID=57062 RepID=A0ABD1ELE0_HYPHA
MSDSNDRFIGPIIPKNLSNNKEEIEVSCTKSESFGPQLPPHLLKASSTLIGPSLPPNNEKSPANIENAEKIIGPSLPPHLKKKLEEQVEEDSESEEDCYGPLPAGMSNASAVQIALEERALQIQIDKLTPQEKEPEREIWMTELPAAKAVGFGLGPRQFRNKEGPDLSDRSSWTDIAGKSGKKTEKKEDLKVQAELRELEKRDEEYEIISKKHKRKSKTLVEIHQDKIKKNEEESGSTERRPFSREVDLQVNKFDDAQKKAVMKNAQLLDDRFSSGKSKYL